MNINTVDLNLFLVLQAIYATRSVTLAGERLGMTQSAVSNALKRIRERFNDPLFVRTTDGMVPSPLAERLMGPVNRGIAQFTSAIDEGRDFDASSSTRTFRLAINDIGQLVMMPKLLSIALQRAPHVMFETVQASSIVEVRQKMLQGEVDLCVGSWGVMGDSFYQRRLFDETFVVLMRKNHPIEPGRLGFDAYLAASHIAYRPSGSTDTELQQTLHRAGVLEERKVVLTAAHSLGLSSMVASSDLLLTAPGRLASSMMASRSDLRAEPTPFEVRPFQIKQQWHERFHHESGNKWLRELVYELFHEVSCQGLDVPRGSQPEPPAAVVDHLLPAAASVAVASFTRAAALPTPAAGDDGSPAVPAAGGSSTVSPLRRPLPCRDRLPPGRSIAGSPAHR